MVDFILVWIYSSNPWPREDDPNRGSKHETVQAISRSGPVGVTQTVGPGRLMADQVDQVGHDEQRARSFEEF